MEPPRGVLASLWNFIWFLPYFIGLLILGFIKGTILSPFVCVIMTVGISAVILGLWPVHFIWTCFSILSSKMLGPVLKLVLCIFISPVLIFWPPLGIIAGCLGGLAYGFLAPIFGTFKAVGEGRPNEYIHCIVDGIWDTIEGSFTVIRDFWDVCFHSYLSIMGDLRQQDPLPEGKYEIRLLQLSGALVAGMLGVVVDVLVISIVAILKSPYMLFKGWHRLFQDCIGREGPFLETICVPFAGLAILLWPLAVAGAIAASVLSSVFLGLYAAIVVYEESSLWFGLCYIVASLSIYDEYSNDVLDLPEGSCFPRPRYRKNPGASEIGSPASRAESIRRPPSRTSSFKAPMTELKPLELINSVFKECKRCGEVMISEGTINLEDIDDAKSDKDSGSVLRTGLPAYCILQAILRSVKANTTGILLVDKTEITSTNRPKDAFFDWFLSPILIIKDQIRAQNLSDGEEQYLGKLVLFNGDLKRLNNPVMVLPPDSELRRAELGALARRLHGITKSISRYPTYRRLFDGSIKALSEDLSKKNVGNRVSSEPQKMPRSRSTFARVFSQRSFKGKNSNESLKGKTSNDGRDQKAQLCVERDVDIV